MSHLRTEDGKAKRFWADELCINQCDVDECSHQVSFMSDIYGSAGFALSWLGLHEDAALAHQLMRTIHVKWGESAVIAERQQMDFDKEDYNPGHWMSDYPEFWQEDSKERVGNGFWNAVDVLLAAQYWQRV